MDGQDNNRREDIFSKPVRAGKRTYFFDVRETRGNDYYLTITESRKRFDSDGYDRHKIFLYKEDFNKFIKGLGEAIDYVKTELMPDFDFDAFNHDTPYEGEGGQNYQSNDNASTTAETPVAEVSENPVTESPAAAEEEAEKLETPQTPTEENNGPVDNGSTEVAEKW